MSLQGYISEIKAMPVDFDCWYSRFRYIKHIMVPPVHQGSYLLSDNVIFQRLFYIFCQFIDNTSGVDTGISAPVCIIHSSCPHTGHAMWSLHCFTALTAGKIHLQRYK